MVNHLLHEYMQQLRHRMIHIPLRAQRRIANEVLVHLEHDIADIRKTERVGVEEATQKAIDGFCPLDEALPLYGPDEGIIRRSSADWILKAPPKSAGRTIRDAKKWGAAAAAFAVAVALVLAVIFVPDQDEGLQPETIDVASFHTLTFSEATTGTMQQVLIMSAGELHVDVAASGGCLRGTFSHEQHGVYHTPDDCFQGSMTMPEAEGRWSVQLELDGFEGLVTLSSA